ncbi:hypothetical protein COJ48_18295 [Bacillus cereus]|uniref:hypothetical protein n=1 Tax=Bacillus paramycoides TaxID=2026194 RepID=UPI000BF5425F|nr:hypothetical protein [Bacillus paramycoides]NWK72628.1 hypothetical protein [Bacillus paramycoides]PFM62697.1 hypothetical protein COJ48_18295 [Bacillus cereus]PGP88760.1 hypothetical protein CN997_02550 [Bacillus cereus]
MAKARGKTEKPPYEEAVSFILEKQGQNYDVWAKQIVSDICVAVLAGENVEWRNKMLEQASIEMLAADIEKRKQAQEKNRTGNSHTQSDVKPQGN